MRVPIALAVLGGCGATLLGSSPDDAGLDATGRRPDATVRDAAGDAGPCTGGDMQATGPDGSCLMFFLASQSFADAKLTCAGVGAHLAILNGAELDSVAETLVDAVDTFIGLSDEAVEGNFVWVDGSPLVFSNWETGEPNDGNGRAPEDCAIIAGARAVKKWDDRPCGPSPNYAGGLYAALCQR